MADPDVCLPADGLINPDNIPGTDIDPSGIDAVAARIVAVTKNLEVGAGGVLGAWRGLGASYTAPESPTLIGALETIEPAVGEIAGVLEKTASILQTFAETAAPIRDRLVNLKAQAMAFVREARAGYTVEWWHSDHPAFDYGLIGFLTTDFVDMGPKWIPWNQYTDAVKRNYELFTLVNEQVAALDRARVEAVNAINALNTTVCVAPEVAIDAEALNQEGVDLPWGSATRGDRTWYESLGDGVENAFILLLDGVGALLAIDTSEEAPEDALFQWDLFGQAWSGLAQGVGAVVYSPVSAATLLWGEDWPPWMQEAAEWDSQLLGGMWEGFVGTPEQWERDPWYAGGQLGFNAGSALLGGGVSAALKGGSLAARLGAFVDNLVPGGRWLVQGVDNVTHDLAASTRGLAAGLAERWGPLLADDRGSLAWLDDVVRGVEQDIPSARPDVDMPTARPDGDGDSHNTGTENGAADSGAPGSGRTGDETSPGDDGRTDSSNDGENSPSIDPDEPSPTYDLTHPQEVYDHSVHNPDSHDVMLGKWVDGDPDASYTGRAEAAGYTYFSSADWTAIKKAQGLDDQGMFDLYNTWFLDQQIYAGKTFHFSHPPINDGTFLGQELAWLEYRGYRYDPETMTAVPGGHA